MTIIKWRHIIVGAIVFAVAVLPGVVLGATQQSVASTAILLQGFHWNSASYTSPDWYAVLKNQAFDIKAMGFTHVWFPPPTDSASREGFLPRQLNNLNSSYGSETELRAAIAALTANGVRSVAEIVINHRVGNTGMADFSNPTWGCAAVVKDDEWSGACGNYDTGDAAPNARDIDHTQSFVQNDLKSWLVNHIKAVGFSGISYDFARGYAAGYAKLYHDAMNPDFCVGQWWPGRDVSNADTHRQQLVNYVDGNGGVCAAFDYTTKGLLNEALASGNFSHLKDDSGKPQGGIGWWPQKMVTFVDNHDTGPAESCNSGKNVWPVPCDKVMQGYAYILTHPGIPTVFYPHVYSWNLKAPIAALIKIRKTQGINSMSPVVIRAAQSGLYAATISGSNGQVAVKIGAGEWGPGSGWTLAASGNNYMVWTH